MKGIFPASFLAFVEREITDGKNAGEYFDLITGTSTGGIIAVALGAGIPASEISALYRKRGGEIFPPAIGPISALRRGYDRWVRSLWRHRYDRMPLQLLLEELLGDRVLGDSIRRLCIPAFDGNYNEVHVFKTPHHPDFHLDWNEKMVDVALATAAAPTFFSVYESDGRRFADGGVWANNPVLIGLVDALACHAIARRSIRILSLGTGDSDRPFTKGQRQSGGLWHWRSLVEAAIQLQSQNADGLARALVGADQVTRIGPEREAALVAMDDFAAANALLPVEAERQGNRFREELRDFFSDSAEPAVAFHGPRAESAFVRS